MTDSQHDGDLAEDRTRKPRKSPSRYEQKDQAGSHLHRSHKHRDDGRHRHPESAPEKDEGHYTEPKKVAVHSEDDTGPFFFIDRKGDPNNVLYGGNDNSSVPRYHRVGYGRVLGLDRRYRISKDGSKTSGYGLAPDGPQRGLARSLLNYRDNPKLELKVKSDSLEGEDDDFRLQHAYIAVESSRSKRRKRSSTKPESDNALQIVMGRSNGSRHDTGGISDLLESDSDPSIVSEKEPDAYDTFRNDVHRQRSIELNRATIERPGDIKAWLALIEHQSYTFGIYGSESDDKLSATDKRSLAELKLALYEKALAKVPDATTSERLILGLMKQGSLLWDPETISKRWQAVLKTASSTDLYIRYLNFRQTETSFNYEECLSIHRECLARAFLEKDDLNKDELCVYVLLRTTTFMAQSGYLERATAIWQALLEFTFFKSRQLEPSAKQSSFQNFWESEAPRIGEAGAAGWSVSKPIDVPPRTDIPPTRIPHEDIYQSWVRREKENALSSGLPARTLDDVADGDPFRVILFSDVEEYLFAPKTLAGRLLLLGAFLKFCGLPALYRPGLQADKWWTDPFLSVAAHRSQQPLGGETSIADVAALFSSDDTLSAFNPSTSEVKNTETLWQRTALRLLVDVLPDDDSLAEYTIAFEGSIDLREARKYVKGLLKSRQLNFRLYNAYALLECRLDRFAVADHAWATTITMCQATSRDQKQDSALMWCSWLWELLRRGMTSRAQQVLLSIPGGRLLDNAPECFENTTSRMRVRSYLESHLAQHTSLHREEGVLHNTELLAIFEYLASSQSLPSALAVYSTMFEKLTKITASSVLIEALHQSRARLLHLHPWLSPRGYRPAEINEGLAESLRMFPDNSLFHQLHQEHICRSGLLERIREVVPERTRWSENVKHDATIIPLLFAISAELSRPGYSGSTHHSIRAAFERGIAAAKPCVRIWTWYIRWEISIDSEMKPVVGSTKPQTRGKGGLDLRRNRAVDLYYRGSRACPWDKQLQMLAFSEASLREVIGDVELRRIYNGMMETGLRLHLDLDQ
jgi:NRDE-2, necessary for RNA interference